MQSSLTMGKLNSIYTFIYKRSQTNFRHIHNAPCIQHVIEVMCDEYNNDFKTDRSILVEICKW